MSSYYEILCSYYSGLSFADGFREGGLRLNRAYVSKKSPKRNTSSPAEASTTSESLKVPIPPKIAHTKVIPKKMPSAIIPQKDANKVLPLSPSLLFRYTYRRVYKTGSEMIESCSKGYAKIPSYIKIGGSFILLTGVGYFLWRWFRKYQKWVPITLEEFEGVIKKCLGNGRLAEVEFHLDRMIDKGYIPHQSLFKAIIEKSIEVGNTSIGSNVLKMMSEVRVVGDTDMVALVLRRLMLRGKLYEATQHIDLLIDIGATPNFDFLLESLCSDGKGIAALKLMEFGLLKQCAYGQEMSYLVLDALLLNEEALYGFSMFVGGLLPNCDTVRLQKLVDLLNLKGYPTKANVIYETFH